MKWNTFESIFFKEWRNGRIISEKVNIRIAHEFQTRILFSENILMRRVLEKFVYTLPMLQNSTCNYYYLCTRWGGKFSPSRCREKADLVVEQAFLGVPISRLWLRQISRDVTNIHMECSYFWATNGPLPRTKNQLENHQKALKNEPFYSRNQDIITTTSIY